MTGRLLDYFHRHANSRGLVLASETRLVRELHASHDTLLRGVKDLEVDGKIEVLASLPYVVVALKGHPWSGSSSSRMRKEQQNSGQQRDVHIEVPVSSSAAAAIQSREVGGAGEGEALLREVVDALDEADPEEFRKLLEPFPPHLIRRALRRTLATPPSQIRKSKAALFRYLLARLA